MHFDEEVYQGKLDLKIWGRMLRFLLPYRKKAAALVVFMIVGGGIDASFTMLQRYAIDRFIGEKTTDGLALFSVAFFVVLVLQATNMFFLIKFAETLAITVCYDLRKEGFRHLQRLSFSYYDKTQVGWIVSRLTSDTYSLSGILTWGVVDIVWALAIMGFVAVYMCILNYRLALIMLAVLPVLAVSTLYFQKRILKYHREVRKDNSKITGGFNEGITGARTSKVLGTEGVNLRGFRGLTDNKYRSTVMAVTFSSLFLPVVMTLGSVATALVVWAGGNGLIAGGAAAGAAAGAVGTAGAAVDAAGAAGAVVGSAGINGGSFIGVISFGTLAAFLTYSMQIFEPLREIARVIANIISTQASAERVVSLLDSKIEIEDSDEVARVFGDESNPKRENWPPLHGDISLRDVTFSYEQGDDRKNVLEHFNIDIRQGETIAFVGETGVGKSTIVNLVCRFYEPQEGRVLIDGVDVRERSQLWLQSHLGYVLQDPHLFSGTIRENIRYGRLTASDAEVEEAAKVVKVHDYILSLPGGYETEVEEGGSRLSTGQKQLISIARAVLADPRIFVLDEATSSVDTETEKLIQDAIQYIMRGRTSLVIAHRLSTIRSADRILVIREGGVAEQGPHSELMRQKGRYYRLYMNQFMDEAEDQDQEQEKEGAAGEREQECAVAADQDQVSAADFSKISHPGTL
ncbi:MAG: ABC transporter ATP-binding protein/permease [Clostridiales bacterium]|nr:ABC transporter ATP-binding protein/permease [Clostridiales bacterium]